MIFEVVGLHHFIESDVLYGNDKTKNHNFAGRAGLRCFEAFIHAERCPYVSYRFRACSHAHAVLGRMADNLEAVAKADEETRQKIADSLEKHFVAVNGACNIAMKTWMNFQTALMQKLRPSSAAAEGTRCACRARGLPL